MQIYKFTDTNKYKIAFRFRASLQGGYGYFDFELEVEIFFGEF